ncbi:MAG: hypothetical protein BWY71_00684 [Planctomycetes bacterium ADurb.Bin412]|nr:MAG: hypothetical protein BWY71_00684 [Planctomycetes bacterium ADurb.Bin412]
MRNGVYQRCLVAGMMVFFSLAVLLNHAAGQTRYGQPQESRYSITADKRPWKGFPWLIGAGLTAITLMVSFKDAKRTHLD